MSGTPLNIERVRIVLHGISAEIAEEAVAALPEDLRRRLGRLPLGVDAVGGLGQITVGPIEVSRALDGAALRHLIAERLADVVGGSAGMVSELPDGDERPNERVLP